MQYYFTEEKERWKKEWKERKKGEKKRQRLDSRSVSYYDYFSFNL